VLAGARLDGMTRCIRLGAVALVVAVLTGLAGCHGKSPAAPSAAASGLNEAQIVAILQEYTQCMRDHGIPGFQQPKLVNGKIQGGGAPGDLDKDTVGAAEKACKPIADRLPDSMWGSQNNGQDPTAAELDKLRQWAACLRQHGLPDWPDPDSRGRFAVGGTPMDNALKSDSGKDARDACRQYNDGGQIGVTSP
jgi:hypothetical protein